MTEEKFYGMRNDYMFHAVLQKNEEVLRHLIAVLVEMDPSEIQSCRIENPIELGKDIDAKDCILDIKLTLNDERILNIEMQTYLEAFWTNRSLLYWARAYDSIKQGEDYGKLRPTYHIGILDFTLFENHPKFLAEYRILDIEDYYEYSDKLRIKVLDLTQLDKVMEESAEVTPLMKWARVFKAETMAELEQLASNDEVFTKMMVTMRELSLDEKIRMQCEAREDYERRLLSEHTAGVLKGIEIERANTEAERIRAEQERNRADEAEREVERLKKLLEGKL